MRYTFIKQHDATDCAAGNAWVWVCLHYRKETTITKLRDLMGTDLKGTNLIGLSKCAEQLGFNCQAVKVDREGFLSRYTLPAILNVYKYSIIAYHGYINGSYHRCDTVSDEPKAFCGNCNDDNHKYSAGIYI